MAPTTAVQLAKSQISIIDVAYAAVAGYGLTILDASTSWSDYALLAIAFFVLIRDWVQEYLRYRDRGDVYGVKIFVLDLVVLFAISRMIYTANHDHEWFYFWGAGLFLVYAIWDGLLNDEITAKGYDWRWSLAGDASAFMVLAAVFAAAHWGDAIELSGWISVAIFPVIYAVASRAWHVEIKSK